MAKIFSTKMAILNSFVKYTQKKCADKKLQKYHQVYRCESEHRNGQTYEKYVGNTKGGRHENVKVLRKEIQK